MNSTLPRVVNSDLCESQLYSTCPVSDQIHNLYPDPSMVGTENSYKLLFINENLCCL